MARIRFFPNLEADLLCCFVVVVVFNFLLCEYNGVQFPEKTISKSREHSGRALGKADSLFQADHSNSLELGN